MMLRLALLAIAVLFSGCAHQLTPPQNVLEHQQKVQAIKDWQLTGKLGIRTPADSGSANLKWMQSPSNFNIDLSGPFNQKHMAISGQPGKVTLEQAGEPPMVATNAEALIKKAAGWKLPVDQLTYWIRGVPAPKYKITDLQQNESGLIAALTQGGWKITYSNYRDQPIPGGTLALPQKIIAEHQDVRLVLAIREWRFGSLQ